MIQCEHFIYGLDPRSGIHLKKSAGVNTLLSDDNLQLLCHIGDTVTQTTFFHTWFPTDNLLAVSRVHPVHDDYGRTGFWNHTILIPFHDYLKLTQPQVLFAPHFITSLEDTAKLHPITIHNHLDPP